MVNGLIGFQTDCNFFFVLGNMREGNIGTFKYLGCVG